jgi:hypothetical protein
MIATTPKRLASSSTTKCAGAPRSALRRDTRQQPTTGAHTRLDAAPLPSFVVVEPGGLGHIGRWGGDGVACVLGRRYQQDQPVRVGSRSSCQNRSTRLACRTTRGAATPVAWSGSSRAATHWRTWSCCVVPRQSARRCQSSDLKPFTSSCQDGRRVGLLTSTQGGAPFCTKASALAARGALARGVVGDQH